MKPRLCRPDKEGSKEPPTAKVGISNSGFGNEIGIAHTWWSLLVAHQRFPAAWISNADAVDRDVSDVLADFAVCIEKDSYLVYILIQMLSYWK